MGERGAIKFEPYVDFPEDSYAAARLYLALLAYPEKGQGLPGNVGSEFATALGSYAIWHRRKTFGLKQVRLDFNDENFEVPKKRDFAKAIERGRRRMHRRVMAHSIIGNQMINGLLNSIILASEIAKNEGVSAAYKQIPGSKLALIRDEIVDATTPTVRQIIRRNFAKYTDGMSINTTGSTADINQKLKDTEARGFLQSRPVLHLVHGLNSILEKAERDFAGWNETDWLVILLIRSEEWVWEALERAIIWRSLSGSMRYDSVKTEHMVELRLPKKMHGNAPVY
jgi:hypothetical protein